MEHFTDISSDVSLKGKLNSNSKNTSIGQNDLPYLKHSLWEKKLDDIVSLRRGNNKYVDPRSNDIKTNEVKMNDVKMNEAKPNLIKVDNNYKKEILNNLVRVIDTNKTGGDAASGNTKSGNEKGNNHNFKSLHSLLKNMSLEGKGSLIEVNNLDQLIKEKSKIISYIKSLDIESNIKNKLIMTINDLLKNKKNSDLNKIIDNLKNEKKAKNINLEFKEVQLEMSLINSSSQPSHSIEVNQKGRKPIYDWVNNFKSEIINLKEFRVDTPNKIQMMLRDNNEFLRLIANRTGEGILITISTNGEKLKESAEIILNDIRSDMRERNIDIKVEIKEEDNQKENNDGEDSEKNKENSKKDEFSRWEEVVLSSKESEKDEVRDEYGLN